MPSNQRGYVVLKESNLKALMRRFALSKANALYRKGSFSHDVIWQRRRFVFPKDKKSVRDNMWIFRNVMMEAKDYTSEHNVKEVKQLPVNHWNKKMKTFRGKLTATDLDHAYWRIAFLRGYISEETYQKGLKVKDKSLRLASLANLSSHKEYQVIENGVLTDKTVSIRYDPILQKVYANIRYECYDIMMECAKLLGDDFVCYKTDCIYYRDTEKNRKKVQDYIDSRNMLWKQLVEPEKPTKDEEQEDESR